MLIMVRAMFETHSVRGRCSARGSSTRGVGKEKHRQAARERQLPVLSYVLWEDGGVAPLRGGAEEGGPPLSADVRRAPLHW